MANEGVITGDYNYISCPTCGKSIMAKDWPAHYNQHTSQTVNSTPVQSVSKTSDDIHYNPGKFGNPK